MSACCIRVAVLFLASQLTQTYHTVEQQAMLKRTPLIKPLLDVNPKFEVVYKTLLSHDRYAAFSYNTCMKYRLEDTRCVVRKDDVTGKDVSDLLLFPFTVTMASTNVFGTLHGGMLMTLVDVCTSFHIAERLLPNMPGHVSINLSTSFITAAKKDDRVVAVCRVDKLGKRIAYTSVDFLLDSSGPNGKALSSSSHVDISHHHTGKKTAEVGANPTNDVAKTQQTDLDVVDSIFREYTTVATGKHVKSIMSHITLGHM
jgi:uncharacterized protein (TIGR00369 family)